MVVAGIDVGSRNTKTVIMQDDEILAYSVCNTDAGNADSARTALAEALKPTGFSSEDLSYVVATGYGRVLVPFAKENMSEIICHAKGAHWFFPSARTILDIGGQDAKAINCDDKGNVTKFVMNDKCAGGTGRFLELISDLFQVSLEEMGKLAMTAGNNISFSNACALFARSEAMTLLRKGVAKAEILAAIHRVLAGRCINLLRLISVERDFVMTGGVCKNLGMRAKIYDGFGLEPLVPPEPLIVGALGAALFAKEKLCN